MIIASNFLGSAWRAPCDNPGRRAAARAGIPAAAARRQRAVPAGRAGPGRPRLGVFLKSCGY
jgi:hypothetical protein